MDVTLLYFDGCPNWRQAEDRVRQAIATAGLPAETLTLRPVNTPEEAEQLSFRGSPTILVDGDDPFADRSAPVGLACRIYHTTDGPTGAPTLDDLTAAFRAARQQVGRQ